MILTYGDGQSQVIAAQVLSYYMLSTCWIQSKHSTDRHLRDSILILGNTLQIKRTIDERQQAAQNVTIDSELNARRNMGLPKLT